MTQHAYSIPSGPPSMGVIGINRSGFPTETSKYVLAIQLTMTEAKWHVGAKCCGVQRSLVVAHKYRVDETLGHAHT